MLAIGRSEHSLDNERRCSILGEQRSSSILTDLGDQKEADHSTFSMLAIGGGDHRLSNDSG
jgi:hypothetical protein